ncbi:iron-sulfur cluster repair di-iron protein [Clostridium chrysemydis]|uniref:iron-sulfur cluster repair di-iron protein n=1 Tax=Clostridium chrysemydis TaxID=2665504 RepID=UPI0018842F48|nr:iron-sulfur cluster repair di-iron protein [Clostridium chrysemydis]
MKRIELNQILGDIVAVYPGAARKFNEYSIDYCCNGNRTLKEALKDKDVNDNDFVESLNKEFREFLNSNEKYIDWRKEDPRKLIKHIVDTHHRFTFDTLRELDELILKVTRVHYNHAPEKLLVIHKLFGELKLDLEEHLIKEENDLFPMIFDYLDNRSEKKRDEIFSYIGVIESEHRGAGHILSDLYRETDGYKLPEWACTTFKLVYRKLQELEKDLYVHIHKENSILFKNI